MELDDLPVALMRLDRNGGIIDATPAFNQLIGREQLPERISDLLPAEEHPRVVAAVAASGTVRATDGTDVAGLRDDGVPFRVAIRVLRPDPDDLVLLALSAAPALLTPDGEADGPATEKGDVDAALSHDVRGALRGVTGFLGLLERGVELPDEARGHFDTIKRSAATADEMTEALVDWLRLLRTPVVLQLVELESVVDDAVERSQVSFAGEPAEVTVGSLPSVLADRGLVVKTLAELITNARKFAEGPVRVTIDSEVDQGWCRLQVSDNGHGIEARLAEDAFRLYRLLQPKGKFPGIGMGLPIARRMIEVQGGRLWIVADDPPGTTVGLRLAVGG
jgi:signal transduction histidine kinase